MQEQERQCCITSDTAKPFICLMEELDYDNKAHKYLRKWNEVDATLIGKPLKLLYTCTSHWTPFKVLNAAVQMLRYSSHRCLYINLYEGEQPSQFLLKIISFLNLCWMSELMSRSPEALVGLHVEPSGTTSQAIHGCSVSFSRLKWIDAGTLGVSATHGGKQRPIIHVHADTWSCK